VHQNILIKDILVHRCNSPMNKTMHP